MEANNIKAHTRIAETIHANPSLLEEGLELLDTNLKTTVGTIDALWMDKIGNHVIVEYETNCNDRTVGQIARYMGWGEVNLTSKKIRGIIVCGEQNHRLEMAASMISNLEIKYLPIVIHLIEEYKQGLRHVGYTDDIITIDRELNVIVSKVATSYKLNIPPVIRKTYGFEKGDIVNIYIKTLTKIKKEEESTDGNG